ncbi:2TM domain-containing protein [Flagellimonas marina]|uniref:2TM domain-containing protein n=1 Tax=Flagellimonas marina TaxID=1775168 RepID=A0ABV8PL05_9FLAO
MKKEPITYERAKKRISQLKAFYSHMALFVVLSTIIIIIKTRMLNFIVQHTQIADDHFMEWLDWNILSIPIIWGAVLLVHGIYVFGLQFLKKWEARQVQKFLENEESTFRN